MHADTKIPARDSEIGVLARGIATVMIRHQISHTVQPDVRGGLNKIVFQDAVAAFGHRTRMGAAVRSSGLSDTGNDSRIGRKIADRFLCYRIADLGCHARRKDQTNLQ